MRYFLVWESKLHVQSFGEIQIPHELSLTDPFVGNVDNLGYNPEFTPINPSNFPSLQLRILKDKHGLTDIYKYVQPKKERHIAQDKNKVIRYRRQRGTHESGTRSRIQKVSCISHSLATKEKRSKQFGAGHANLACQLSGLLTGLSNLTDSAWIIAISSLDYPAKREASRSPH